MLRIKILLICFLLLPGVANAAVIFQDNFDTCTTGCTVGSTEPNSAAWWQWHNDSPSSATISSVTHYSGEITSPGRGGTGKSLKLWRGGANWTGSGSYSGPLLMSSGGNYNDFYIRFYAKIPAAMLVPDDTKMFRLNTTGGNGNGEIYMILMGGGGSTYLRVYGNAGDSGVNTTLVTSENLAGLLDGNWHAWQLRYNLTTGTVTFWGDGIQLGTITNTTLQQGAWTSYMQHFPLGNSQGGNWQAAWQSFETDDLIIATTKAETDPDGADSTAPATSISTSDPSSISSDSLTVTGTASDAVGVSGCKWRLGSAPDAGNGTACTGTTSWSCSTSGYQSGANTLYVGCYDAAGNYGTDTVTVTYTPASVTPARVSGGKMTGARIIGQ